MPGRPTTQRLRVPEVVEPKACMRVIGDQHSSENRRSSGPHKPVYEGSTPSAATKPIAPTIPHCMGVPVCAEIVGGAIAPLQLRCYGSTGPCQGSGLGSTPSSCSSGLVDQCAPCGCRGSSSGRPHGQDRLRFEGRRPGFEPQLGRQFAREVFTVACLPSK